MKHAVVSLTVAERERYPIRDLVEGWFFRVDEQSIGHYVVEGVDLWRRKVRTEGDDPDALLQECVDAARYIQARNG